MTYCDPEDVKYGNIPLPTYVSPAQYVTRASEEIDATLGHIYSTPITFNVNQDPSQRPSMLILKKINWLLASGRLILDIAASSEARDINAYGRQMLNEGIALLQQIEKGEINLKAERIKDEDGSSDATGPVVINEDEFSRVEDFYSGRNAYPSFTRTLGVFRG